MYWLLPVQTPSLRLQRQRLNDFTPAFGICAIGGNGGHALVLGTLTVVGVSAVEWASKDWIIWIRLEHVCEKLLGFLAFQSTAGYEIYQRLHECIVIQQAWLDLLSMASEVV